MRVEELDKTHRRCQALYHLVEWVMTALSTLLDPMILFKSTTPNTLGSVVDVNENNLTASIIVAIFEWLGTQIIKRPDGAIAALL